MTRAGTLGVSHRTREAAPRFCEGRLRVCWLPLPDDFRNWLAVITLALVPLAPGESLGDVPAISLEALRAETVWSLPTDSGEVRFAASVDDCRVVE